MDRRVSKCRLEYEELVLNNLLFIDQERFYFRLFIIFVESPHFKSIKMHIFYGNFMNNEYDSFYTSLWIWEFLVWLNDLEWVYHPIDLPQELATIINDILNLCLAGSHVLLEFGFCWG